MQKAKINISKKRNDRTSISNIFIDQYMRDANGDFVKVYLYLLRSMNMDDSSTAVSDIADLLNLTEKDVIRAIKYWVKVNALEVTFDEDGDPIDICFLELEDIDSEENTPVKKERKAPAKTAKKAEAPAPVSSANIVPIAAHEKEAAPAGKISRARLAELQEQEEFSDLFFAVERYVGRPLNATEMETVGRFYDHLGFGVELIEYLVQYCVVNHHTSFRYMETVANAWADQGVRSIADAKEIAQIRSKNVMVVMKTFGINDRTVTDIEMDFINRWFKEYAFDPQIVEEACKRTIKSIGKANFSYAEKILKDWHESKIHTLADLTSYDAKYKAAKVAAPTETSAAVATGNFRSAKATNNFNNFSNRTYNFDELEKSLLTRK